MLARNIFGAFQNVSIILGDLENAGMRIEVGDDFALYRYYRSTCVDRGDLSALFDTASSFIDETNGFWICGFNEFHQLVHTQAVRLLNLRGISLGEHLDMHRHKYIVPYSTPDPDLTFFQGPEALKTVTGSVSYCGDFWLPSHGLGGPRSHGATSLLSRLLFEVLQQAWSPDFVFAFVPRHLAAKGAHLRYGYTHCEPGAWIGPDKQITNEEYLIWMNSSDIKGVLARDVPSIRKAAHVAARRAPLTSIVSTE